MKTAESRAPHKALAALIGFLARGAATGRKVERNGASGRVVLVRGDGAQRKVAANLLWQCLSHGLVDGQKEAANAPTSYTLNTAGRATLRRLLADPDSAFSSQHRRLSHRTDPDLGVMTVNDLESPLAALARIKARNGGPFLTPDQVDAGERLRSDFTRAQLTPALGQRWEPVRAGPNTSGAVGGIADLTDAALSARQRFEAAITAVGPELSGVLLDACCFLKRIADIERERQWPARSAKLMLRTALAALARHYAAPNGSVAARRHTKETGANVEL